MFLEAHFICASLWPQKKLRPAGSHPCPTKRGGGISHIGTMQISRVNMEIECREGVLGGPYLDWGSGSLSG